jgi:hypothetical protein
LIENAPDHSKMKDLARILGIPLPYANGIMERLWHYTGKYCPDGGIGRKTNNEIAEACAMPYEISGNRLIEALLESRFLDRLDACRLFVHDWPEHCTHYIHRRLAKKKQYFADNSVPSLTRVSEPLKSELIEFYQKDSQTHQKDSQTHQKDSQNNDSESVSILHTCGNAVDETPRGPKKTPTENLNARAHPTPTPTPYKHPPDPPSCEGGQNGRRKIMNREERKKAAFIADMEKLQAVRK